MSGKNDKIIFQCIGMGLIAALVFAFITLMVVVSPSGDIRLSWWTFAVTVPIGFVCGITARIAVYMFEI